MVSDVGLNSVEIAIVAALDVAGITALVPSTNHYNSMVPPDGTFPAVIFQLVGTDRQGESFSSKAERLTYLVKCITKGEYSPNTAGATADAIDAVLEGATLSPTGWTVYASRRVHRVRFVEFDDEKTPFWHAGGQYQLWTTKP